jgi:pyruvate ferredoxin oxidoreductase gamma subunit
VRFHGRGGHGVKTAGRIVGTAAFRAGFQAQDCPVYGPERRGAAVTASTRLDTGPILERGAIRDPDLIILSDATLLADPTAGVRVGADGASALFVNTAEDAAALAARYAVPCPTRTLDLSALASEGLGRGTALSALLGAVACGLTGALSEEVTEEAVREELTALHLNDDAIASNVALARRAIRAAPAVSLRPRPATPDTVSMHVPAPLGVPRGVPLIFAVANTAPRHTGSWRTFRPVIDRARCTRCSICFIRCPDGAFRPDAEGYPAIDADNCKGCLICCEECPVGCIHEEKEAPSC